MKYYDKMLPVASAGSEFAYCYITNQSGSKVFTGRVGRYWGDLTHSLLSAMLVAVSYILLPNNITNQV